MEITATKASFQKYSAYKESGEYWMGEIPSNWETKKLKHLFKEKKIKHNHELGCGAISFGQVITKDDDKIPESTKASYQEVLDGEFLVNPLNLNYDLKSLRIALSNINVVVSSGYIVLKDLGEIDRQYYKYLLHRYDVAYMKLLGSGVRQTINFNHISNSLLAYPSLQEQTAIANFLDDKTDKIDRAIAQKEQLIALLKERKQIIIQNAVTKGLNPHVKLKDSGVEWIGEIPDHWDVKRLGNISKVIDPQPDHRAPKMDANGLPYLGIRDINTDGTINIHTARMVDIKAIEKQERAFKLEDGDLLYGKVGTLGNPKRLQLKGERVALSATLVIIKVKDQALSRYLKFALDSQLLYSQINTIITGATRPALGIHQIRKFFVVCPPAEELGAFVTKLESILIKYDQAITLQQTQIEKLKEYKATLIDSAVTGKIKVC